METDEEVIRIKVRNTLVLKKVSSVVMDWVKEREQLKPQFKGHYDNADELVSDLKIIADLNCRKNMIEWLKSKHIKNHIITQAIAYFEKEKT